MSQRSATGKAGVPLLLDEMHAPGIAAALRARGYDAVALVADPELRGRTDEGVLEWAAQQGRCLVTENVPTFRRLVAQADEAGRHHGGILYTSSRTFPRSRRNPAPLIDALTAWLDRSDPARPRGEDWLRPAE